MSRSDNSLSHTARSSEHEQLEFSTSHRQMNASDHIETTKPQKSVANSERSLKKSIPLKLKYQGNQREHVNSQRTRESMIGHGNIATVKYFEDDYLRECEDCCKELSDTYWNKVKDDLGKCKVESEMYPILAKFLTRICVAVCNPKNDSDECLAVFIIADSQLKGKIEGSVLRPDLVFKWTTYETAMKIICSPTGKVNMPAIKWSDVISYVEAKRDRNADAPSAQASSYCHILPRAQPDLAGIHYSVITPDCFFLYWGDTSGIVRSHRYLYEDQEDWSILFRYVTTLVEPLLELPTRDSTMEYNKDTNRWTIKCKDKTYKNCELIDATCGQSRQTCVFLMEASKKKKRIVKDLWFDEQRRFKEADLLKKIKGVPGVVQGDFSDDVPAPGTDEPFRTSEMHSGPDSRLDWRRKAPRRRKKRCILKSVGKKLKTRRSLLQIVKAIHDSLRAHQMCLKYKRVLHRDVSRYNILVDPEHFDVKKFAKYEEAKFLGHILDKKTKNKEDGMLIDWDTAADLEATDIGESLTHRTGTPIYVARSISKGSTLALRNELAVRHIFPEMSEKAKTLYIRAFGEGRYEKYQSSVNNSPRAKVVEEVLELQHMGFHDVESFVWVLFHELLLAWPRDSEDEGLNEDSFSVLNGMKNHTFGMYDRRPQLFNEGEIDWKRYLHPDLEFLSAQLERISLYFKGEWAYWPELPEDHAHEALAIMLLEMACLIEEKGDIELREDERGEPAGANTESSMTFYNKNTFEVSPPRIGMKRAGDTSLCSAPKKSKTSRITQDNAQAGPSVVVKNELARKTSQQGARLRQRNGTREATDEDVHVHKIRVYSGPMTRSRTRTRTNSRNREHGATRRL